MNASYEYKMIDPRTVLVATPTYDGKVVAGFAGGLSACAAARMYGNVAFLPAVPIGLARNLLIAGFLSLKEFQWIVFIDSDIGFSANDFNILMDYPIPGDRYMRLERNDPDTTVDADGHALIVTAEYSKKLLSSEPAKFGLGFTRIKKDVFEIMIKAVDENGNKRIGDFVHKNDVVNHFFPEGPGFGHNWFGEDTGFFHLARLCGIRPRIEQRCQLLHVGSIAYPYVPPTVRTETNMPDEPPSIGSEILRLGTTDTESLPRLPAESPEND